PRTHARTQRATSRLRFTSLSASAAHREAGAHESRGTTRPQVDAVKRQQGKKTTSEWEAATGRIKKKLVGVKYWEERWLSLPFQMTKSKANVQTKPGAPARGVLPSTELERVFAVLRFVARQQEASAPSAVIALGDNESNEVNTSTVAAAARANTGKRPSAPLIIPGRVEKPLEAFRMAVTNFPVQMEAVQAARATLHEALRDAYPAKLAEVDQLCQCDSLLARAATKGLPQFLLLDVYSLQAMHEVVPGLYVGSYHPASDKALLRRHNVTHVLCCIDVRPRFPTEFTYLTIRAQDSPNYNISKFFAQTYEFIEGALIQHHSGVLVHCGAGISRAPTVAAAYLINKLRLTAVSALELIQRRRHVASPNIGFLQQLRLYQESLGI
ncbi:dual specificity protein phosphatase, partial [Trypanosoma conorhini]